jgi:hypothetical protein
MTVARRISVIDTRRVMPSQPFQASSEEVASATFVEAKVTVPADKRAAVEFVSFEASVARGASVIAWISTTLNGTTTFFSLVATKVGQDIKFAGQDDWSGPQELTLYADPGSDIVLTVESTAAAPIDNWARLSVAGFLEDVPA